MFQPQHIRQQFPFFQQTFESGELIYFDNAATTQKPQVVIDSMLHFYQYANANVHRSSHSLGQNASLAFESARQKAASFINAESDKEIIWTKGCTESINLLCQILGQGYFQPGQEIVISALEHHANLVPWLQVARQKGLQLKVIPITADGKLDKEAGLDLINDNTALLAIAHVSNALGNINPVLELVKKAKEHKAFTLIDGAQAVAHLTVDVQELGCDFYAFSGHKMYGPTGIGVLYGRRELLEELPAYQYGGEMVKHVSFSSTELQPLPFKFEAGTPNVQGVLGLSAAIDFVRDLRTKGVDKHEQQLYQNLLEGLMAMPEVKVWGDTQQGVANISFTVTNMHIQDLGILLNEHNIALRVGHHCAMPLMQSLKLDGTLRVSLACYNTQAEVDYFLKTLRRIVQQVPAFNSDSDRTVENTPAWARKIKEARSWDETYRQLMLAGKTLKPQQELRLAEHEIFGCESQVWLKCEYQQEKLIIQADSNSKIVRGLLVIMLEPLQQQTADKVADFDLQLYMQELGLGKHLSASRNNGLASVLQGIKSFVEAHKA